MRRLTTTLALGLALAAAAWGAGRKAPLLDVSKGTLPNSGPPGTKVSLDERPELGGVCLKVVFQDDTWFAEMRPRDWSSFETLRFDVLNPAPQPLNINLTIKHKGSIDYDTRVDKQLPLQPGKNSCELALAGLANNNGTRADLSVVKIWSIDGPKGATLYFGSLWLEGEVAQSPAPEAPKAPAPAAGGKTIRIKGTVDITITGLENIQIEAAAADAPNPAAPAAPARKATLIAISKGTLPKDVADVELSLAEEPQLGGVALKARFGKDAWFADSNLSIKDWRGFASLKFVALNPGKEPVSIDLTIKHKGTKDYDTRVDRTFALAPGKNPISIPLAGIANNDGSSADLSVVNILTVSCGTDATVLFGDFTLE